MEHWFVLSNEGLESAAFVVFDALLVDLPLHFINDLRDYLLYNQSWD